MATQNSGHVLPRRHQLFSAATAFDHAVAITIAVTIGPCPNRP
ncbi:MULTISPECIES: hypothetical protein [unclassified Streptomyces]